MISPEAFLFGFTQGFVIGPLSLYAIREGLNPKKGSWYQIQVLLGSFVVDFFYLLLATYGMAQFVEISWIKMLMWVGAAYLLIKMGVNSIHERPGKLNFHHIHKHKLSFFDTDFFRGLVVSLFNPMAVVFSLMVIGSLYASYNGPVGPAAFAVNVNVGGFVAGLVVCLLTFMVRQVFHPWMIRKLMLVGSFVLIIYGLFFSWKAIQEAAPMVDAAFSSLLMISL